MTIEAGWVLAKERLVIEGGVEATRSPSAAAITVRIWLIVGPIWTTLWAREALFSWCRVRPLPMEV